MAPRLGVTSRDGVTQPLVRVSVDVELVTTAKGLRARLVITLHGRTIESRLSCDINTHAAAPKTAADERAIVAPVLQTAHAAVALAKQKALGWGKTAGFLAHLYTVDPPPLTTYCSRVRNLACTLIHRARLSVLE